ncbi:anthranilate synthase component II [Xanthovirga aplysinae]|uniref:anthranilate synthase component II n=1 Tax=Xanthovirga aplysinae TaxID=2529853 RepID=UPI0012BD2C08|nr:aminodeoxychorismate/anthranilate synthase component II [Xanthovirga aplysinae]MTI31312.1 aminodeoxychorismate/anthranilate synthase component II [Xanthovirga aplysinae]
MILILDNFDSFTYNLVDYFNQLGVESKLFRNNINFEELISFDYKGVVLSPGPESPEKAGCLMQMLAYYSRRLPILGICLGHQAIGEFFGADLVKAEKPMHGKISTIHCKKAAIFNDIKKCEVVRYHSLILDNIPACLQIIAQTEKNEIMAIQHKKLPITGLQFHPEAWLSQEGFKMLQNWVNAHQLAN